MSVIVGNCKENTGHFDCKITQTIPAYRRLLIRRFLMSTLEAAITFSLILVMLAFMITGPEAIALDSLECARDGGNELFFMERDKDIADKVIVGGVDCYDTSPEKLCTYLSGISDNFRLIYGSVYELSQEAADEEN
jgi:hypothetical protein